MNEFYNSFIRIFTAIVLFYIHLILCLSRKYTKHVPPGAKGLCVKEGNNVLVCFIRATPARSVVRVQEVRALALLLWRVLWDRQMRQ